MGKFRGFVRVSLVVLALTSAARAGTPAEGVVACTPIKTAAQLQAINNNAAKLQGTYCLMNDIDLRTVPNWTPIGGAGPPYFSGTFYGNGHVIRNLTISGSVNTYYGLFGAVVGGSIRDVGLVNVNINVTGAGSTVGALIGVASAVTGPIAINNVYSTGRVRCPVSCEAGGLLGQSGSVSTVRNAWSSADVISGGYGGGLAGIFLSGSSHYEHLYATGNVTGTASSLSIGGLIGVFAGNTNNNSFVVQAFATGRVTGGTNTTTGGLIGSILPGAYLQRAYATGPVSGGGSAIAGGLVGSVDNATIRDSFSAGPVTGASIMGGLIGEVSNAPSVTSSYWDKMTSGQAGSAAGTGKTTAQLRNAVPADFSSGWGISRGLSYPFMSDPDDFTSTLATLVSNDVIFTLLPIRQADESQYLGNPSHTANASLAAVYTMIARAVGVTENVATLKNVKIDRYFWHDATQTTTFSGPVATHATLGALKALGRNAHLDATNVVGQMNARRLVILRGAFAKARGGAVTHYMLGTLYTKTSTAVHTIVANDPWTGTQVEIDPVTRKVVTPGFPLKTFKVNGYRTVTTLN